MDRCLVGLIGCNILKSLSPALHEDAFAAAGIKGHYHLMDLDVLGDRTDFAQLFEAVRIGGFAGTNVTFPFKEAVLALLDEISPEAKQIGAVNTVVIGRDGRTRGDNTDRIGFRRAFEETIGKPAVAGQRAVLVGAGGAGRAVAFALIDLGVAKLSIYDKDQSPRRQSCGRIVGPRPDYRFRIRRRSRRRDARRRRRGQCDADRHARLSGRADRRRLDRGRAMDRGCHLYAAGNAADRSMPNARAAGR